VGCGSLSGVVVSSASGPGSDGAHQGIVGGREEALDIRTCRGSGGKGRPRTTERRRAKYVEKGGYTTG
jgi:hypothetical protein